MSDFPTIVRLFPLPNLVLFPRVVQGLHIFETRYRQMTADALASDKRIALVMLRLATQYPTIEADIADVACLGEIIGHEQFPDGRYNLRLRGLHRVRILEEVPSDRLYRLARVDLLPETTSADLAELTRWRRDLAAVVLPRFADNSLARQQLQELFDGDTPLGEVCDILAYALPLPAELKQALLAEPQVERRAETLIDTLRVSAARAERPFPPPFSVN
ncbi:MAG: LON peptidase substrate-binding domain-containing protein [Gemmataceae bacterium]|nr:LON peptidase substrate-binding domain-containing protein [Gemmata sp.]MDW8197647.1 LON peptidase substrate-binding domain-containing protein [Gemmataceae bacterium]